MNNLTNDEQVREGQSPLLSLSPEEINEIQENIAEQASSQPTQSDTLYEKVIEVLNPFIKIGIGSDEEIYCTLEVKGKLKTYPLKSKEFRRFIIGKYKELNRKVIRKDTVDRVIDNYEAEAFETDVNWLVANRVKFHASKIYYDLHNKNSEIIEIDSGGWKIISSEDCPVKFPKRSLLKANVTPVRGGSLELLRPYINVANRDEFILICSLVLNYCYKPPYPILGIIGQQGSSKTTLAKVIAEIVDPSICPINSHPHCEREIFIMTRNSHLLSFDNLSGISNMTADTFCRLVTGAGFRSRELYSDADEKMIYSANPIIGNGIDEISDRGDLLSRMVQIRLPVISPELRKTENEFWDKFEADKPKIMGAVFDALSIGLRNLPKIKLHSKPRMADFALFACATAEALETTPDQFMNAYIGNIHQSNSDSLELDPVVLALQDIIQQWPNSQNDWVGTMTQLLHKIVARISAGRILRNTPASPQGLSRKLNRLIPILPSIGIGFESILREAGTGKRLVRLYRIRKAEMCDDSDDSDNEISF
jgi:hypothetical protein